MLDEYTQVIHMKSTTQLIYGLNDCCTNRDKWFAVCNRGTCGCSREDAVKGTQPWILLIEFAWQQAAGVKDPNTEVNVDGGTSYRLRWRVF